MPVHRTALCTCLVLAYVVGSCFALMEDQPLWKGCQDLPQACTVLEIFNSNIDGPIPTEIGLLTNLQRLSLYNSMINATIPTEIGHLTDLTMLNLHNNYISGKIPSQIGNLTKLAYFYAYNNLLLGSIPSELGLLTGLESLFLSSNQIKRTIPSELGALTNLYQFSLHKNNLTGTIPSELGNLKESNVFFLSKNFLTGTVPPEVMAVVKGAKWSVCDNDGLLVQEITDDMEAGALFCSHMGARRSLLEQESAGSRSHLAVLPVLLGLVLIFAMHVCV